MYTITIGLMIITINIKGVILLMVNIIVTINIYVIIILMIIYKLMNIIINNICDCIFEDIYDR